jgi:hypothetical protein
MNKRILGGFVLGLLCYTAVALLVNKDILQATPNEAWSVVYGKY